MSLTSCVGLGLSHGQFSIFKSSLACACRKMTTTQILDAADHLHDIIRTRSAEAGALNAALDDRPGKPVGRAVAP